ncbi:unnamed protein product [Bursaphelenchus okinawaensis]|uniref:L-type lectin-like domain-containing protein n=1 Tax=Bursaphelenchus okinawaensis TaxID=465554 RepID=A0A811JPQ0_9BILA|nr:unnamed protein product [Bursaphelenchus okinawaensis]CAG9076855.1 unnamed protein product [Bursaphelenchus okinawaensis]
MASLPFCFLLLLVQLGSSQQHVPNPNQMYRRFEYKHSFRAPNLAQRDGTIPFWVVTGDAIASSEQLRLAPSMRSRKGIAWNKRPYTEAENFEVEVAFKITGQRIGADGLGIWYTANQGTLGPVFGANDHWNGLALMFDSFDNDGRRNNPYVSVMVNDGTKAYNHQSDGADQILGGCQRDFRNKPYPVKVRLQYLNNVLTVDISDGLTPQPRYETCLRAENVFLPSRGFFGVSAATGGLADDHDVVDFSVYSLATQAQREASRAIPQDERQKYDAEFEKQMHEFEEEKKKYKEQHPDKVKEEEEDPGKYYEDAETRELRMIHEGQSAIYKILQQMEVQLADVQKRSGGGGGAVSGVSVGDGFQQHEKNEVIQALRDLTNQNRDSKNYINEIFTRTYNIEQKLGGGIPVQQGNQQAVQQGLDPYVKQSLDNIHSIVQRLGTNQGGPASYQAGGTQAVCPEVTCATPTLLVAIVLVQTGIILAFVFVRSKPDKAKFY